MNKQLAFRHSADCETAASMARQYNFLRQFSPRSCLGVWAALRRRRLAKTIRTLADKIINEGYRQEALNGIDFS